VSDEDRSVYATGKIVLPRETIHENTRLLYRKIYGIDVILFPWKYCNNFIFFLSYYYAIRTAFSAEGEFVQMIPRSRCIRKQFFIYICVWYFNYKGRTILLDTDLKIILDHQNNFVGILKITGNAAKNFNILTTSFYIIVLIEFNKINFFDLYPARKFKSFSKTVFFRVEQDSSAKFFHKLFSL